MEFFKFADTFAKSSKTYKQFFIHKVYAFNWKAFRPYTSFETKTPLFKISIFRGFKSIKMVKRLSKPIVTIGCNFERGARSQKMINSVRMPLLNALSKFHTPHLNFSMIRILLLPAVKLAQQTQINIQIKQILQYNSSNDKKIRVTNTTPDNFTFAYQALFPFNLRKWLDIKAKPFNNLQQVLNLAKKVKNKNQIDTNNKIHWILCHLYILQQKDSDLLIRDIIKLINITKRFNFFTFFQHKQFGQKNMANKDIFVFKFIKTLKWESSLTQKYLIFCVRIFGGKNIERILQDFKQVAEKVQNIEQNQKQAIINKKQS